MCLHCAEKGTGASSLCSACASPHFPLVPVAIFNLRQFLLGVSQSIFSHRSYAFHAYLCYTLTL